jgi:hypothetical protein
VKLARKLSAFMAPKNKKMAGIDKTRVRAMGESW